MRGEENGEFCRLSFCSLWRGNPWRRECSPIFVFFSEYSIENITPLSLFNFGFLIESFFFFSFQVKHIRLLENVWLDSISMDGIGVHWFQSRKRNTNTMWENFRVAWMWIFYVCSLRNIHKRLLALHEGYCGGMHPRIWGLGGSYELFTSKDLHSRLILEMCCWIHLHGLRKMKTDEKDLPQFQNTQALTI